MTPEVSVITVAYESGEALTRLLDSLENEAVDAVVVNNAGARPEVEAARARSWVRVLEPGQNLGFAEGCNLGASAATADVLVFLNPDTVVAPGALAGLVRALGEPRVGIAMPRLRLLNQPDLLNSGGNIVHVTGLAWAGRYGEPAAELTEVADVPYASGAALAIRADLFKALGGFLEPLFMYQEDLELCWRARLRGLRIVVTPEADVYHDYEFGRNQAKRYLLERNRLIFVFTTYSPRLLAVLGPVLFFAELGLTLLAVGQGWFGDKAAGWRWLTKERRWLRQRRRQTQKERRLRDRDLAACLSPVLDPKMFALPRGAHAANALVSAYWRVARKLL